MGTATVDTRFYEPTVFLNWLRVAAIFAVFAGIAARNGTPIDLPGGRLALDAGTDGITDGDVIEHVYGRARLPIEEWRRRRGGRRTARR